MTGGRTGRAIEERDQVRRAEGLIFCLFFALRVFA